MNKFDKFWEANKAAGQLTFQVDHKFGKYGTFSIDNADIILEIIKLEKLLIPAELLAVTWMNETTFRFYSEPNKNHMPNNFEKWDVGPFQMNVGILHANIERKYLHIRELSLVRITGLDSDMFNGDPIQNGRAAARLLMRGGSQALVAGPKREIMFPAVAAQEWATMPLDDKNLRRAVAFTGPEARPARAESFKQFGPMFKKFFKVYNV